MLTSLSAFLLVQEVEDTRPYHTTVSFTLTLPNQFTHTPALTIHILFNNSSMLDESMDLLQYKHSHTPYVPHPVSL